MRDKAGRQAALVGLCVVLVVIFAVVVQHSTGKHDEQVAAGPSSTSGAAPSGDDSSETSSAPAASSPPTSAPSAPSSGGPTPDAAQPNFPISKLAPGQAPPQFIIFSFDGAGSAQKWTTFSAAAKKVDARFTGFLTGTYLLTDAAKSAYQGPGHAPGTSSVGFGGTPQRVADTVAALNAAKAAGHEVGTHFNGHFCAGAAPSGKDWTTAQWNSELDQFFTFLASYQSIGSVPGPALTVTAADIKGERTPCLEGKPEMFFPALLAHGLTYDTSLVSSGLVWPKLIQGIWEFYMPYVRIPASGKSTIAMDYNFWIRFNNGADDPASAPQITQMVLDTYRSMLQAALAGNHAPLVIGNHFNDWSGNAFNPAAEQFMLEACGKQGVVCTTYQHVLEWMGAQDPAVLQTLSDSPATVN
ncbi:polysaccharide deacetylase family protein [Cumulibacter manganitolerans]|uniref:hypothetical protein n=1 Tax=Cumulibacter manganitolerans TaxID=1884992 RepID=UPI001E4A9A74|nr:hypothetical protein [Cumulibacter manganitolerans]